MADVIDSIVKEAKAAGYTLVLDADDGRTIRWANLAGQVDVPIELSKRVRANQRALVERLAPD